RLPLRLPDLRLPDPLGRRLSDLSRAGLGLNSGDRRGDAGDAAAHARLRRGGSAAVRRRLPAARPALRDQRDGVDADGQLHVDEGYAYDFLAILHAITVIFTLLWLPFGKFFHIFQRPAQLGVGFYKDVGAREEQAKCRRCGEAYASRMHVEDLIGVEKKLGFRYEVEGETEHYQWVCPKCRRAMLALAQGRLWRGPAGDR